LWRVKLRGGAGGRAPQPVFQLPYSPPPPLPRPLSWSLPRCCCCGALLCCCGAAEAGTARAARPTAEKDGRSAEHAYDALKKYARDLTQAARDGKLDPVIGRDEEIRRTIQVLSRRTKNNPC
jgi:hypothetical protein